MEMDEIVAQLTRIARARDAARAAGLVVEIPPVLRDACAEIVRLAEQPHRPAPDGSDSLHALVPLRQVLWHVIEPGEQITVTEVAARLAQLGRQERPSVVSNALGYWVRREKLERTSKGVYQRP